MGQNLKIPSEYLETLRTWDSATNEQVRRLKHFLLPDDEVDDVRFHVTEHPGMNKSTRAIYTSWYDIEVYTTGKQPVCDIVVDVVTHLITYSFL